MLFVLSHARYSQFLLTYGANPDNRTGCGERWNRLPAAAPPFECEREQSKAKEDTERTPLSVTRIPLWCWCGRVRPANPFALQTLLSFA
jgi:hypothetical protein